MTVIEFKCGVCGTTASFPGSRDPSFNSLYLGQFQKDHAKVCPGYPPTIPAVPFVEGEA